MLYTDMFQCTLDPNANTFLTFLDLMTTHNSFEGSPFTQVFGLESDDFGYAYLKF